jgi:hypothetical protein
VTGAIQNEAGADSQKAPSKMGFRAACLRATDLQTNESAESAISDRWVGGAQSLW